MAATPNAGITAFSPAAAQASIGTAPTAGAPGLGAFSIASALAQLGIVPSNFGTPPAPGTVIPGNGTPLGINPPPAQYGPQLGAPSFPVTARSGPGLIGDRIIRSNPQTGAYQATPSPANYGGSVTGFPGGPGPQPQTGGQAVGGSGGSDAIFSLGGGAASSGGSGLLGKGGQPPVNTPFNSQPPVNLGNMGGQPVNTPFNAQASGNAQKGADTSGFGPQAAKPNSSSPLAWQNFRFTDPQTAYQKNFNALADINPDVAFSYGFNPTAYTNYGAGNQGYEVNSLINGLSKAYGAGTGQAALNSYITGNGAAQDASGANVGNGITSSLGLPSNWSRPETTVNPNGTVSAGGKTYTLPAGSYQTYQQWAQSPQGQAQLAAQQQQQADQSPGSAAWWAAVQKNGG